MSSINNLVMASAITDNPHVSIKKGLFGLTSNLVYTPTGSKIRVVTTEYSKEQGERMHHLLSLSAAQVLAELREHGRPTDTPVGPIYMEALASRDGCFFAAQLFRYAGSGFEPFTGLRSVEGTDAASLAKLLP